MDPCTSDTCGANACAISNQFLAGDYQDVADAGGAVAAWHDAETAEVQGAITGLASFPGSHAMRQLHQEMTALTDDFLGRCDGSECGG